MESPSPPPVGQSFKRPRVSSPSEDSSWGMPRVPPRGSLDAAVASFAAVVAMSPVPATKTVVEGGGSVSAHPRTRSRTIEHAPMLRPDLATDWCFGIGPLAPACNTAAGQPFSRFSSMSSRSDSSRRELFNRVLDGLRSCTGPSPVLVSSFLSSYLVTPFPLFICLLSQLPH